MPQDTMQREVTIMLAQDTITRARRRDGLLDAAFRLDQKGWHDDAEVIRSYAYRVTTGIETVLPETKLGQEEAK